jgi:hypothetical protein
VVSLSWKKEIEMDTKTKSLYKVSFNYYYYQFSHFYGERVVEAGSLEEARELAEVVRAELDARDSQNSPYISSVAKIGY